MQDKKVIWRLLTVLQEDTESQWLQEMSRQGWHLAAYHSIRYTFKRGEPKEYIYQFDYQWNLEDKEEYIAHYEELGWEFILTFMGWQYFRCEPHKVKDTELLTDINAKLDKYKKLLYFLGIIFVSLISISVSVIFNEEHGIALKLIYGLLLFIYIYLLTGLYKRIRDLKR